MITHYLLFLSFFLGEEIPAPTPYETMEGYIKRGYGSGGGEDGHWEDRGSPRIKGDLA